MQEVDLILDPLSKDPETFDEKALAAARQVHNKRAHLDMPSPLSWRKSKHESLQSGIRSVEELLRAEIDSIVPMKRDEEARLARRIVFAGMLLDLALKEAKLDTDDLEGCLSYDPSTYRDLGAAEHPLPELVQRRWFERHAMRTELVERNLYLVLINVERYAHLSVPRMDLIQEGSASMFRAVDGFDWKRGLLFRTYAVHWLKQAFRSALYNFGTTVRVPVYLQKAMRHVRRAVERLGKDASNGEIAEATGIPINVVRSARAASRRMYSLESASRPGDDSLKTLKDSLEDESAEEIYSAEMEDLSLSKGLAGAMDRLSDRERFVLEMRFGLHRDREYTLAEVAAKMGVSLERIRQIQMRAIAKMRTPTLRKAIDPFLEA